MTLHIEHFHHRKKHYLLIENAECPRHRCASPVRDTKKLNELNDKYFPYFNNPHKLLLPFTAHIQDVKSRK